MIKGAIVTADDREIMVYLPEDWQGFGGNDFIVVESYLNVKMTFNMRYILNIREVTDQVWQGWLTRLEATQNAQKSLQEKEANKLINQVQ